MKKKVVGILSILLTAAFLFAFGIEAKAEDGVTDNEIRIGSTMDLSGPIAYMGQNLRDGINLYFKYVNDNGGVYGRKLKLLVEDDGYQSPRAVQAAKKLVTKDKIFAMFMTLGAASTEAMYPFLVENNVILFIPGTQNDLLTTPPRKLLFLRDTGYTIQGGIAVKYMMETLKAKHPKVAVIYQDDITGQQYRDGVKKALAKYNIKDVLEFSYKRGAVDFSSQVAQCKSNGVTHIFTFTVVREPAMIFKEAERIQYKATYFTPNASVYPKTLELAGSAVDFTNGYYGISLMGDENSKGYKFYREMVKKYKMCKPDEPLNVMGFSATMTLVEVLKRTGKNLTREGFIKAAETMKDYDVGLSVPQTWTPTRRDGGRQGIICKAEKGKWVRLTGWVGAE